MLGESKNSSTRFVAHRKVVTTTRWHHVVVPKSKEHDFLLGVRSRYSSLAMGTCPAQLTKQGKLRGVDLFWEIY